MKPCGLISHLWSSVVAAIQIVWHYLNGEKLKQTNDKYSLSLPTGQHQVIVIAESVDDWGKVSLDLISELEGADISVSNQAPTQLSAKQLFDSKTVSNVNISPNGKLLIWQTRHYNDKNANKAITSTSIKSVKSNGNIFEPSLKSM